MSQLLNNKSIKPYESKNWITYRFDRVSHFGM